MFQSNAGTTTVTDTSVCGYAGDKSGNAFHITSAADDTTRPTWNNNGGLPYLNFDGSNDLLRRTASLGMYAAGALSIFVAVRSNSPTNGAHLISERSTSTTETVYLVKVDDSVATSSGMQMRDDAGSGINLSSFVPTNVFNNSDNVFGITDDGANLLSYVNGAANDTGTYTRAGTLTPDTFGLCGSLTTGPTAQMAARIYGLIIVKRVVTAQERANITTYLGAKVGLSL